jgi:hypothetical protein
LRNRTAGADSAVLIDISSATLRKMVKLSERKEALMSQIQELDRQMAALQQPAVESFEVPARPGRSFWRASTRARNLARRAAR